MTGGRFRAVGHTPLRPCFLHGSPQCPSLVSFTDFFLFCLPPPGPFSPQFVCSNVFKAYFVRFCVLLQNEWQYVVYVYF